MKEQERRTTARSGGAGGDCEVIHLTIEGEDYLLLGVPSVAPSLPPELSVAQRNIAMGVLEGKTNEEIALDRGTSPRTIANQLQSLYRLMRVSSRAELRARLVRE